MLKLRDVHTCYGETLVLRGISLDVEEGAVVALLGRNGMGKTTIIRSIIGFTPPKSGLITFKGKQINRLKSYQIAQMGIALVPQGRRIFSSLSVRENLTMSARNMEKSGSWSLDRVHSLFPILMNRANLKGHLLSGGEQQMLCIARALMTNPDLLLMDEPSEGLAVALVKEVHDIVIQLKKSRISILLVEQNLPFAISLADYVYIVSNGVVVYESTPEQLRDDKDVQAMHLGVGVEGS